MRTPKGFPGGRRAWRRDLTRERILDAACQVLMGQGFDSLRVPDVADRADVGLGTVYNYFGSKEDLGASILAVQVHDLSRRIFAVTAYRYKTEPSECLPLAIQMLVRDLLNDPAWRSWFSSPSLLVEALRQGLPFYGFKRLCNTAGIPLANKCEKSHLCWRMLPWMVVGSLCAGQHETIERESEGPLVDCILHMLRFAASDGRHQEWAMHSRNCRRAGSDPFWAHEIKGDGDSDA